MYNHFFISQTSRQHPRYESRRGLRYSPWKVYVPNFVRYLYLSFITLFSFVSFVFQSRNITAKVVQPHLSTWEVTRSRSVAIARQRESRSVKRGFELKCRSRAKLHFRNRHFFWPRRCTCPHRRGKSAVRYFSL